MTKIKTIFIRILNKLNRFNKKLLIAEWIEYQEAYRIYLAKNPQNAISYSDDMDSIVQYAEKSGYKLKIIK